MFGSKSSSSGGTKIAAGGSGGGAGGIKIAGAGAGAQRPADGFPRFTESYLSPPSADAGCWKVYQGSTDFGSPAEYSRHHDSDSATGAAAAATAGAAVPLMALGPGQGGMVRSRSVKGVGNLGNRRGASKVFSLAESGELRGDVGDKAMQRDVGPAAGGFVWSPDSSSESAYLSRVPQAKALALKKGRLSGIGSRDLSQLESRSGAPPPLGGESDESHHGSGAGALNLGANISRILSSYDRHSSYMESPRHHSPRRSPDSTSAASTAAFNLTALAWKRVGSKKFRKAPLVNFSKCTFSCAGGNLRPLRAAADALPKQLVEMHACDAFYGSRGCDRDDAAADRECSSRVVGGGAGTGSSSEGGSSIGNSGSLRRSFRWLYGKVKAMGNESPDAAESRAGACGGGEPWSPEGGSQRGGGLDKEWKKLALEQSERMSSMLDILRNIASKLDGMASAKDSSPAAEESLYCFPQQQQQQSGRGSVATAASGRQSAGDKNASAKATTGARQSSMDHRKDSSPTSSSSSSSSSGGDASDKTPPTGTGTGTGRRSSTSLRTGSSRTGTSPAPTLLALSDCVRDARVALRHFADLIGKESCAESSSATSGTTPTPQRGSSSSAATTLALARALLPRDVRFVKPWHTRYGLESFVSAVFFADFEQEGFGTMDTDNTTSPSHELDPSTPTTTTLLAPDEYLAQYGILAGMDPHDATDAGHPDYDPNFHWFCERKLQAVHAKVGPWVRGGRWSPALLRGFLDAAKRVWRLHMLAFAFPGAPAQLVRAHEAQVFCSDDMEPVDDADGLIVDAKAFCSQVELTVMPGFRVPQGTVRCKVYLKPKSARTDKRSPRPSSQLSRADS